MSHEKHGWTTELTLDRFVRETGHSKHMLHLTVWRCVMLWVDVSANCPFQGSSGWELECGNWQALFMRAHIRKYHLRETKLYCPWQKCSDFQVLKRLPQSAWGGYGPSGSCCYCAAGCTSKVCTWFFVVLIDHNFCNPSTWLDHVLTLISEVSTWTTFLSTLKMKASCCFKYQGQLTVLKGDMMQATIWMAWTFENTI